jgi:hypothetical protein
VVDTPRCCRCRHALPFGCTQTNLGMTPAWRKQGGIMQPSSKPLRTSLCPRYEPAHAAIPDPER